MQITTITGIVTAGMLVLTLDFAPGEVTSQAGERTFQTGITGSAPAGPANPTTMMSDPAVRDLILALAEGPVRVADAERRLDGATYTPAAIVDAGLARVEDGRLRLALNYVSAEDQRRIAAKASVYGRELGDLILARRAAIEAAVRPFAGTDDERRAILFFLVGCMALDWDGLAYTAGKGYRTAATVTGAGYAYTPWMKENAPDISRRGLYWGSHNRAAGAYTFTTFGDHHALPRAALPDLFFSLVNPFRGLEGTDAAASGRGLVSAYSPTMLSDIARVLVAIDGGARSGDGIAAASDVAGPTLTSILTLLERLGYVQQDTAGYTLRIAVLKKNAGPAAARVVALVREAIDVWHQDRLDEAERELSDLTALRQGVPYKVLYSEIWHYVFGYANRHLSERGLITDPYAPSAPFRGFVPVLWATSIDASG